MSRGATHTDRKNASPAAAVVARLVADQNRFPTMPPVSAAQKRLLARQLGYETFEEVVAASSVMKLADGSAWWLTKDQIGRTVAWNCCALDLADRAPASDAYGPPL